ncbi:hypothetical protein F7734_49010 [Scytonema sp. UIC 10036]|nr:hypothetical protein [Scytonema sp. UIC 10036]
MGSRIGFGIWDLGIWDWDLGFGIWDLGFGNLDLDLGFGFGFGIWDLDGVDWRTRFNASLLRAKFGDWGLVGLGIGAFTLISLSTLLPNSASLALPPIPTPNSHMPVNDDKLKSEADG